VNIDVEVSFMESKSGKVIWEDRLSNWGTYDTAEIEEIGQDGAIVKLVEDILNRTVKGW
jgi:hypothetical protein